MTWNISALVTLFPCVRNNDNISSYITEIQKTA